MVRSASSDAAVPDPDGPTGDLRTTDPRIHRSRRSTDPTIADPDWPSPRSTESNDDCRPIDDERSRSHDPLDTVLPMTDPLLTWRAEFPILDTCTYLVSHSLGAMPRRTAAYLQQFADDWSRRGVRAWHEGWWEIGRTTGRPAGADPRRGGRLDLDAPERDGRAWRSSRRVSPSTGRGNRIVMTDLEFPVEHVSVRRLPAVWRGDRVRPVAGSDAHSTSQRCLDAIDERTLLVPLSYVLFKSAFIQDVASGDREGAPGRGARDPRRLSGGRHGPARDRAAGSRLRRRRIREVAVRRARGRLPLRPAGSRQRRCVPASSAGRRTPRRSSSPAVRSTTPTRRSAFRAAPPTCRRYTLPGPATRSSRRSACRRSARSRSG